MDWFRGTIRAVRPVSLESNRELLRKYIMSSEKEILVRAGELYSGIWGHPDIEEAIKQRVDSVNFSFICGPYIDILDNVVIRLGTLSSLKLYRQEDRGGQHYRVFDDGSVFYFEDEHSPLSPGRNGLFVEGHPELGREFKSDHLNQILNSKLRLTTRENYLQNFIYVAPKPEGGLRVPSNDEFVNLVQTVDQKGPPDVLINRLIQDSKKAIESDVSV